MVGHGFQLDDGGCITFGVDEVVRYTYRLRPGAHAARALESEWHRCRFLWNEAVHQRREGGKPNFSRLSKMLTEARARTTWLREGSQVAQQQTLRTYSRALDQSFKVKGRGLPVVKSRKKALPSLEYTTRGFGISGGRLTLPKGVSIPVVWSRELPCAPTSVRVYRDSLGHWYASFVVRRSVDALPVATGSIGIDWGITTTATTTDPDHDLPYLGHRKRCAAELARAQRKMARRRRPKGQAQSNGYRQARREAARLYKKAARQNTHTARVWARRVVADYHTIAVEDFKPKFLARSTMARKAADAAIGAAKRELIERATRAGRRVVLVPPAYTTMTCASCGARAKQRLALDVRIFCCGDCGHAADRDRNAAAVILAATVELDRVSVDDVRHCWPPFGAVDGAVRAGNPPDLSVRKG
ncbi:transposase [Nocardia sp. Root136]|uniref:RNA-guided endonuclease InsQ/TnpB family protein n=1 Tax=Nocardia sp. Root136 TaxID=1736458 RepID=UPI0006FC2E97|nr:RNA-guided endonuclease TnpB family protein [Nocardia sp. Root136]KQY36287.1 transposase [Nocardia sp. Root136]